MPVYWHSISFCKYRFWSKPGKYQAGSSKPALGCQLDYASNSVEYGLWRISFQAIV
jgi:hypothetical protein